MEGCWAVSVFFRMIVNHLESGRRIVPEGEILFIVSCDDRFAVAGDWY